MPGPTSDTTIQRPDLGMIAYEYALEASQRGFIGGVIMPQVPVSLQSADYPVIPTESLLRERPTKRAPRSAYERDDWEFETGTYACEEHGIEEPIDDGERKKYEGIYTAMDIEAIATKRGVDRILRGHERRVAAIAMSETALGSAASATAAWSTAASAKPINDVKTSAKTIQDTCGLRPNVVVMSRTNFTYALATSQIADAVKYTNPVEVLRSEASMALLAQCFDVERVLVGDAVYNASKKRQSFSATSIWGDTYVLLARVASNAIDLEEACLGRTFLWVEDSPEMTTVEQYREDSTRSDIVRVRHSVDEAVMFTGCCKLIDVS